MGGGIYAVQARRERERQGAPETVCRAEATKRGIFVFTSRFFRLRLHYKTLEDAFIAAKYPDMYTITLLCDVTDITSTVTVSGSCTLDMNGFDITGSCTVFHVTGALTLLDLTDSGSSLTSTSGDCAVLSDWVYQQWNVNVISETGAAIISNIDNTLYSHSFCIYSGTASGKTYGVYSKVNVAFYGGTITGGTAYYFSEAGEAP